MTYSGWAVTVPSEVRYVLPVVVAEHITHMYPDDQLPPVITQARIMCIHSNTRVQAGVVEVTAWDGVTMSRRPDGRLFHVTLSRSEDASPVESNDLLNDIDHTSCGQSHIELLVNEGFLKP